MSKKYKQPYKDERDQEIEVKSESYALEFLTAATQILTILCLIKGNTAWKGSLALLFVGAAAKLFYKYKNYNDKPYLYVSIGLCFIGILLFIWFGISG